ncbi:6-bladed beta-propeller [Hydrogenophaga sp. RWCD_12]|uniref:6-bladed beta-propeller n=1 Tax=Hydrogenophaga sp. RWCD_12 TaxID=3391190 RepID=UPI003985539E
MNLLRRLWSLWLLVALGQLAACADVGPVRGQMHYGMADAPEGQRLMWPAAPEVPRFLYSGTLVGEPNFRTPAADPGSLRSVGRWLAGLDEKPDAPLVLQRPSGLTGDGDGRLFVSDTSRQAVFVFDEKRGELLVWEYAEPLTRFVAPSGLAVGPDGALFVADADLGVVVRLDARGEPQGVIGRGRLQRPTGLARDPRTGDLYVADTYAHDIKVFDAQGQQVRVLGRRGEGMGEFNFPTHMVFANGALYVTDTLNSRVQVYDPETGGWNRRLGSRGLFLGDLVRPKGVAVDGEGNVYVVESYYDSLLVFSPRGEFLLPIGGTGTATGRFYLPAGVWVDGRNRVHVADMFNGRVVLFQFLGGG